jgi:uncharacterized protein YdcH (DUF465 family)
MENRDRELVLNLMNSNSELKRLYDRHMELENSLSQYNTRVFLTPDEEMAEKRLKKEKLCGVDRMMEIVHTVGSEAVTQLAM